jgi:hypothetical protein
LSSLPVPVLADLPGLHVNPAVGWASSQRRLGRIEEILGCERRAGTTM